LLSTNNLARTTKGQNIATKYIKTIQKYIITIHKRGPNKQQYNIKHAEIYDRQS